MDPSVAAGAMAMLASSIWRNSLMRNLSFVLLGALTSVGLFGQAIPPPKTTLKIGDMAPDFTLNSTQGGKVKLSDFRGKNVVVLAFYPAAFTGG